MGLVLRSLVTCIFVTYAVGLELNFPEQKPCIMAHMNVSFSLSYDKDTSKLSDPEVDTKESKCADSLATLTLKWGNSSDTLTVYFMKKTNKVEMALLYKFIPKEHFKDLNVTDIIAVNDSAIRELSWSNMSYKCNSLQEIELNEKMYKFEMRMSNVQVQAFDVTNGNFSKFEECSKDTFSTEGPATTSEPLPFEYRYPKSGNACILLEVSIQLDINYMDNNNKTATANVNIPRPIEVTVTGKCAEKDTGNASIILEWNMKHSKFSVGMDFIGDKERARLQMIEVIADLSNKDFQLFHNESTKVMSKGNVDMISSLKPTYYKCSSRQEEKLDNTTTVMIYKIQVQAFGVKDSNFTGNGTECSQDLSTENPTTATTPTQTTNATTHTTYTTSETTNGTMPAAISTTASAPHPRNSYSVRNGNVTCVYFEAGMDFTFPYTTKNGTNTSAVVSVPQNSTADGTCDTQNVTTNKLIIYFYNWNLTFVFGPDNSSSQLGDSKSPTYSVQSIMLEYTMNHTLFPGYIGNETEMQTTKANITGPLFQSKISGSYKCNGRSEVPFIGDIKLETYDLQYKAFNKDNKTDFGGDLTECAGDNSSDNKTNSIVPIAVGAALAGLVVIVLIAYLIGRRRKKKEYEPL